MLATLAAVVIMSPQRHSHMRPHKPMPHMTKAQRQMKMQMMEEASIKAGYRQVSRTMQNKDWNGLRGMMTADFKQRLPDGTVLNAKQATESLRGAFAHVTKLKVQCTPGLIQLQGDTATVEARYWADGKFTDKKGQHHMHAEGSERDRLRKIGGMWKAAYIVVHDHSVIVDGHVVAHMP